MRKAVTAELHHFESGYVVVKTDRYLIKANARYIKKLPPESNL